VFKSNHAIQAEIKCGNPDEPLNYPMHPSAAKEHLDNHHNSVLHPVTIRALECWLLRRVDLWYNWQYP
jgi:hypothetical protein